MIYALPEKIYNQPYAVAYQIGLEHMRIAYNGEKLPWKQWAVHWIVGGVELLFPLVGQIIALVEKTLVQNFRKSPLHAEHRALAKDIDTLYNYVKTGKVYTLDSENRDYRRQQPDYKCWRKRVKENPDFHSDLTRRQVQELASCPELIEARGALEKGIRPQPLSVGISGSYILLGYQRQKLGIFKPKDEEPGAIGNPKSYAGFDPNPSGYRNERTAYLLDKKEHFSGVPLTKITSFSKKYFLSANNRLVPNELIGSFQKWVPNTQQAAEVYSEYPKFFTSAKGPRIPVDEIHKIAILDIRTLNCDRHMKNFLVDQDGKKIYPIDHGYTLMENALYLRFDWMNFPQAKKPFSANSLNYIKQIDIEKDLQLIQRKLPSSVKKQAIVSRLRIALMLLKEGAKQGLTPYQIGDLMIRRPKDTSLAASVSSLFFNPPAFQDPVKSFFERTLFPRVNPRYSLEANVCREVLAYQENPSRN